MAGVLLNSEWASGARVNSDWWITMFNYQHPTCWSQVGKARILKRDVLNTNGIIHVIDKVLLPASVRHSAFFRDEGEPPTGARRPVTSPRPVSGQCSRVPQPQRAVDWIVDKLSHRNE